MIPQYRFEVPIAGQNPGVYRAQAVNEIDLAQAAIGVVRICPHLRRCKVVGDAGLSPFPSQQRTDGERLDQRLDGTGDQTDWQSYSFAPVVEREKSRPPFSGVENWRADGRVRWQFQPLSRWPAVRLPLSRFQPPPRQTRRADFRHRAFLSASRQGLCSLSCRERFRRGPWPPDPVGTV